MTGPQDEARPGPDQTDVEKVKDDMAKTICGADNPSFASGLERLMLPVLVAALVAATLFRLLPVMLGQPALSEMFMTEDGYLMLTVARSMAIGQGMTVSDGTIATNGVQPLATFLFAVPYVMTEGDKVASLVGIHLISAAIALAGAFAMQAFAARALAPHDSNRHWPWLAAVLWFTGPLLLRHTMNGLETGLATLFVLLTLLQFARVLARGADRTTLGGLGLGALCGLVFLSRNDAVFLVVAIFVIWGLYELIAMRAGLLAALRRTVPPGLLSLLIVLPWLINNQLRFGSIVPISGTAQSLTARFGDNADLLPSKLFEYLFPMLPVPHGWETHPAAVAAFAIVSAIVILWAFARTWQRGGTIRLVMLAYLLHLVATSAYYGLYFGAPHFFSRYLAPSAPLLVLASLIVLIDLSRWIARDKAPLLVAGTGLAALALSGVLLGRLLLPGVQEQGHFQVVQWVDENVGEDTWVGAVQTGTLGYWHDRTINLDGKVNPAALAQRREYGNVMRYIVASEIDYLVDWNGIRIWAESEEAGFSNAFELHVDDAERNLAVLRRLGAE